MLFSTLLSSSPRTVYPTSSLSAPCSSISFSGSPLQVIKRSFHHKLPKKNIYLKQPSKRERKKKKGLEPAMRPRENQRFFYLLSSKISCPKFSPPLLTQRERFLSHPPQRMITVPPFMIMLPMQIWTDYGSDQQKCVDCKAGELTLSALQQTVVLEHVDPPPAWKPVSKTTIQSWRRSEDKDPDGLK